MIDWIREWEKVGIVDLSSRDQVINIDNKNIHLFKDMSDEDGFVDKLICQYHGNYKKMDFPYEKLKEIKDNPSKYNIENPLEIYISYDNWEQEREVVENIKSTVKSAIKKNKIENDFLIFKSIYFSVNQDVDIRVDNEGVNYLVSPLEDKEEITGFVINCSFAELKKLYNITGVELFRSNVRNGIIDDKSIMRSIFSNYLHGIDSDVKENEEIEIIEKDLKYDDYDPALFWFSHNGITLFVDKNIGSIAFQNDSIKFNSKACSVINGAQTITNFFLVYSELRYNNVKAIKSLEEARQESDMLEEEIQELNRLKETVLKLDDLLSKIFIKLTIISGKGTYSPFITKGLNTQSPITQEDFAAISKNVEDINKVARSYIHILKTGEVVGNEVLSLSPLQFVKQYLIADSQPGRGKNFNNRDLVKQINELHKQLVIQSDKNDGEMYLNPDKKIVLEKMEYLSIIDNWWKRKNIERGEDRSIVDKYGKNYFQSFVLMNYESFIDNEIELDSIFEQFEKLLESRQLNYNNFKDDKLYNDIVTEYTKQQKDQNSTDKLSEIEKYEQELFDYLSEKSNDRTKIHYRTDIEKFNESKEMVIENLRIVKRNGGNVLENFHLPTKTFKELYQNLNIEEKLEEGTEDITESDFPEFEDSILYQELQKKYNIIVLDFNNSKLTKVNLKKDFDLELLEKYPSEVKTSYKNTITAFIEGDMSYFPKANKNTKVHVRPKALRKDDSFLFTNGELLTKRTFWVTKYYLSSLLHSK